MKKRIFRYVQQLCGFIKLSIGFIVLNTVGRKYYKHNIWIIAEKRNEARDNGYHFFKYLREHHPEINVFYVITKDSPDLNKILQYGNIVWENSLKHCIFYLAAIRSISSQAYGAYPFNFNLKELMIIKRLCNKDQKTIHLRHGIQKDELAHEAFDYDNNNIDLLISAAPREYDFIKKNYGYPDNAIKCLGFCRFDRLFNRIVSDERKIVLVMPTWRFWLKRNKDGVKLTWYEVNEFLNSDYYKAYESLLSNRRLLEKLHEKQYKLCFYLHYQMQDFSPIFKKFENNSVVIADRYNYDVQDLLICSKMLVTDYSSVFFDFAYMNKPEAFYQFDYDRFTTGHYKKGYFSYENDAFGPCFNNSSELVEYILDRLENDCLQVKKYEYRVNEFFDIRDNKNCERTYSAVHNL